MMFKNIEIKLIQEYGNSIGIHHCKSKNVIIHTEIGEESKNVDIVVVIHDVLKIAIVWNIKARRIEKCTSKTLTYSKTWEELICENHEILTPYKSFKANGQSFYEKIIVLDINTLFELSLHLPELLEFDAEDDGYPNECKDNKKDSVLKENKTRTRITTSRWNRDCRFSKGVLEKYNYRCVICRCNISQLLEAAHERGYEVCNTVTDMVEHGICLCRNHHAMYDKMDDNGVHLIDIDLKSCTIKVNDERIMDMPWYDNFITEYKGKIYIPLGDKKADES